MEFIDSTGHILSLCSSYTNLGWEYNESEYVFWMNGADGGEEIFTSSYYIMQIVPYIGQGNTLGKDGSEIPLDDIAAIKITCCSSIFKIVGYDNNKYGKKPVFDVGNGKMQSKETFVAYRGAQMLKTSTGIICPFFVVCLSDEPGTFMTNVIIEIVYYVKDSTGKKTIASTYAIARVGADVVYEPEKLKYLI